MKYLTMRSNNAYFWPAIKRHIFLKKKKMKTCHNNFGIIIEWNSIFHNDKISLAFDMGIRKFHFVWQEWITFFQISVNFDFDCSLLTCEENKMC